MSIIGILIVIGLIIYGIIRIIGILYCIFRDNGAD